MKYIDFKIHFEQFQVFSINDIRKWDPDFDTRRLVEWQQKGYLKKIINRWYFFSDKQFTEELLYLAANKIYAPSYISFESALAYYSLIPEGVYMVTSASSLKTNLFDTSIGQFRYRHFKPEFMFGYRLVEVQGMRFRVAEPEKAVLDYLYLNPGLQSVEDMEALRINSTGLGKITNANRMEEYLSLYKNKALEKRVKVFQKSIDYA